MKKTAASITLLVTVAVAFILLDKGVKVAVRNVGTEPLRSVVVHVTGNSYPLGDIQSGELRSARVFPNGESNLQIEHAGGRLVVDTYLEGGYRGKISVDVTTSKVERVMDDVRIGVI